VAPILFYLDGLKEAHENGNNQIGLQGPEQIELSVTSRSITLLIDVAKNELVYHSAEVDYLDPKHPLIMVFPSAPLKHNTHYALAVVGAPDENGQMLPPTKGMKKMLEATDTDTRKRTFETVIPALEKAAEWFSFTTEPQSLQLVFDFVTVSEQSQLGPVRMSRDKALEIVGNWNWGDHVDVLSVVDHGCCKDCNIARTIHFSLDVPSFLDRESRYSFLDLHKLTGRHPVTLGKAKALVQIPCSIRNSEKEAKAIIE
jgi:hypothetical protein